MESLLVIAVQLAEMESLLVTAVQVAEMESLLVIAVQLAEMESLLVIAVHRTSIISPCIYDLIVCLCASWCVNASSVPGRCGP